jgi:hypothetical protein
MVASTILRSSPSGRVRPRGREAERVSAAPGANAAETAEERAAVGELAVVESTDASR